jgi:ribose-phosphate pyrophosphokinase
VEALVASHEFVVLGGSTSSRLALTVAAHLRRPLARSDVLYFSDGNLSVRVLENVRGRDAFIIQAIAFPVNDSFVELLFWIDALRRASAASVTAVIPYFSYAKGDKMDEPRVSIRARVCADAIVVAGADRVVTVDAHAEQIQGFFSVPVDDLQARPVLCDAIAAQGLGEVVVVSPDAGFAAQAWLWADRLGAPLATIEKRRPDHTESAEAVELVGSVDGATALLVDDFTVSAGTLVDAARLLKQRGAEKVHAAITHGLFTEVAHRRLAESLIEKIFMTDTVETQRLPLPRNVQVVSIAPLLGDAVRQIATRNSVSELFT